MKIVASAIINRIQLACYAEANWKHETTDDNVMVLHTLVVDPLKIGKGYGATFVKYYEQYAVNHNCSILRMDTQESNITARNIYAKLRCCKADIISVCDGFNGLSDIKLVLLEKKL
ncbi:GNAT family N-acetyltransferase [Bacteroides reticulotermitis]|uniref:GNAT family N-acetyltransferase n=1 Tax=Bacteroides reticulotermitis TaxID=1133319 RepID=UPI003A877D4B